MRRLAALFSRLRTRRDRLNPTANSRLNANLRRKPWAELLEQRDLLAAVEWNTCAGGNGHFYEFVSSPGISWDAANAAATSGATPGHLVTISSQAENDFVANLIAANGNPKEVWLGAQQVDPNVPAADGWTWVTGEPFGGYTHWQAGEPNDNSGGEQYLGMWGPSGSGPLGTWNDQGGPTDPYASQNIGGYVVEWDANPQQVASPFTVYNTNDSGPGSLRQAILNANVTAGHDTITFDIPGVCFHTIQPHSALPAITDAVTIDGYTQPGASVNTLAIGDNAVLKVELDGSQAGPVNGFNVNAGNSTIKGLAINRFPAAAIYLASANNLVVGNFLGTDPTGSFVPGPQGNGVGMKASYNIIGGTTPDARNIISGHYSTEGAVSFVNSDTRNNPVQTGAIVQGNYIGTDATGTVALPNLHGLHFNGVGGVLIGGTQPGAGNLISGNNGTGIDFNATIGDMVQGNLVGTDVTGKHPLGNNVGILNGTQIVIGGTVPGAANVISGNGIGAGVGWNSQVQGNLVGTDISGSQAIPNGTGLLMNGFGSVVGGAIDSARNVISGNTFNGINFGGDGTTNNRVQGNYIGTDITGLHALGNGYGVWFQYGASSNWVGTDGDGANDAAEGNLISGNRDKGISVRGPGHDNVIAGNLIGTDKTGNAPLLSIGGSLLFGEGAYRDRVGTNADGTSDAAERNVIVGQIDIGYGAGTAHDIVVAGNYIGVGADGVTPLPSSINIYIFGGSYNNRIGGRNPGEGNIIANGGVGVLIDHYFNAPDAVGNTIVGNSIYSHTAAIDPFFFRNGALGIDINRDLGGLGPDGPNPNISGGSLTGNNLLQNYPVIAAAYATGGTFVRGALNSRPGKTYTLDFYANSAANPSGYGEGQRYMGYATVTTDASGNGSFAVTLPAVTEIGDFISATATDPAGNTSEFSLNKQVTAIPSFVVTTTSDAADGDTSSITALRLNSGPDGQISLREAILAANNTPGADTIGFNIPGSGVQTIRPLSALPAITDSVTIDGYTQFGASPNTLSIGDNAVLKIELDGSHAGPVNGFNVNAGNSTIKGLAINRFPAAAIYLASANNLVVGNFFGTDPTGSFVPGPQGNGVGMKASYNVIGGTTPDARNIISGHYSTEGAISFVNSATRDNPVQTGAIVQGNYIGTDATGTVALPNLHGLHFNGVGGVTIGGTDPGAGNLISGNTGAGIDFNATIGDAVQGNLIGTDVTGTCSLGNNVGISRGTSIVVGGTAAGAGNLISGNRSVGMEVGYNSQLQGNLVGTDISGSQAIPNGTGLLMSGFGSVVGGTAESARNVISGNTDRGITFGGDGTMNNRVQGNYIGTDITGLHAIGNGYGVWFQYGASSNWIGTDGDGVDDAAEGNVVSGNQYTGISVRGPGHANVIAGNLIGTDKTGNAPLLNIGGPLLFGEGAYRDRVGTNADGTSDAAERNVIVGQIDIGYGAGTAHDIVVAGNNIGIGADGTTLLGGSVYIFGGSYNNRIGGTSPVEANVIRHTGGAAYGTGIVVDQYFQAPFATGNAFLGNSIAPFGPHGLGIDLNRSNPGYGGDGQNPNDHDPDDTDAGNNNLQNYPMFTSARVGSGKLVINYRVESNPVYSTYPLRVEFFAADASGTEGETFLGYDTFTTADFAASGKSVTLFPTTAVAPGMKIVATATDAAGNTSEFSTSFAVTSLIVPVTVTVVGGSFTYDGLPHGATSSSVTATGGFTAPVDSFTYVGTGLTTYGPSSSPPINAGTYTVTAIYNGDAGHAAGSASDAITIVKADATVIAHNYVGTYDAQPHTASVTIVGVDGLVMASGSVSRTDAGHDQATASISGLQNYNDKSGTATIDIAQADAIFSIIGYSVLYDGQPHTATGTATGVNGENLTSLLNLSGTTHADPASYLDSWTFAGNTNYKNAAGLVSDHIVFPTDGFSVETQAALNIAKMGDVVATVTALGAVDQAVLGTLASGTYGYRFVFTDSRASVIVSAAVVSGSYTGAGDTNFALSYRNSGSTSPLAALVTSANTNGSNAMSVRFSAEVNIDGLWYELGSEAIKAFLSKK